MPLLRLHRVNSSFVHGSGSSSDACGAYGAVWISRGLKFA